MPEYWHKEIFFNWLYKKDTPYSQHRGNTLHFIYIIHSLEAIPLLLTAEEYDLIFVYQSLTRKDICCSNPRMAMLWSSVDSGGGPGGSRTFSTEKVHNLKFSFQKKAIAFSDSANTFVRESGFWRTYNIGESETIANDSIILPSDTWVGIKIGGRGSSTN